MYKLSQIPEEYKKKLITAEQAAALVKDGDRVSYGLGCAAPYDIDIEIGKRAKDLHGVEIVATTVVKDEPYAAYLNSDSNEQIRFATAHMNGFERKMSKAGRCWFIPILFNELPKYWENIDKIIIQVHPMDQWGNFNLGPQASDLRGLIRAAKTIILEVNQNMPKALGYETELNLCDVDYVVEGSNHPMPQIPNRAGTEVDDKIADYIIPMIEDGSTLQLGIGGIPSAVGRKLAESDVKDLSGHTEMLVDSYVDLYEAGKITGNKNRDKGKIIYAFAGGTQRLYDFINDNQIVFNAPVSYVNNVGVVASIDKFISINGCIDLDLYGQVNAETAGYQQISGTGGQLDFLESAAVSKGGKAFICLTSSFTNKEGEMVSRINPLLTPGDIVTDPRSLAYYIVTEYGTALLKGKSTWERAEALINIAHPDFREELIKDAEKMGIWTKTSKISM